MVQGLDTSTVMGQAFQNFYSTPQGIAFAQQQAQQEAQQAYDDFLKQQEEERLKNEIRLDEYEFKLRIKIALAEEKRQKKLALDEEKRQKKLALDEEKRQKKLQRERENQVKKQLDQQNKYMSLAFSGVAKTATTAFEGLAQIAILATASKIDALGSPEVAGILSLFSNEIAQGIIGVIGFAINAWFQKAMFKSLLATATTTAVVGEVATIGGAATTAVGSSALMATITGALASIFAPVTAALTAIALFFGAPVWAVVATIAAIGVSIYAIYKNWGWITKTLGNMWKWFQNSILNKDVLLNVFKLTPFGMFLDLIVTGFKTLTDLIMRLPWFKNKPKGDGQPKPDDIKNKPTLLDNFINTAKNTIQTMFPITSLVNPLLPLFKDGKTKPQPGDIINITKTDLVKSVRGGKAARDFVSDNPWLQAGATESLLGVQKLFGSNFRITGGMGGKHTSVEHRKGYGIDIGEIAGTLIDKNVSMSTYTRNPAIAQFVKTMNQAGWYQPYPDDTVHWKYKHPSNKTTASEKLKAQSIKTKTLPKPTKPPVGKLPDPAVMYAKQQTETVALPPVPENLPTLPTTSPDKLSSASFNLNEINYRLNIVDQMNYGLYPQV